MGVVSKISEWRGDETWVHVTRDRSEPVAVVPNLSKTARHVLCMKLDFATIL